MQPSASNYLEIVNRMIHSLFCTVMLAIFQCEIASILCDIVTRFSNLHDLVILLILYFRLVESLVLLF